MKQRVTVLDRLVTSDAIVRAAPCSWRRRAAGALRIALLGAAVIAGHARAQVLETETARLLPKGTWEWGAGFVYQGSSAGREAAVPIEFGYGITDWLQLDFDPVVFSTNLPTAGGGVNGFGDTDVRLTCLLLNERDFLPAFAVAGELKISTADERLIGTGEDDWTAYAIASKRFGDFDVHANYTRTFVGQPSGMNLKDFDTYAFATVYTPSPGWEVFGEYLASNSTNGVPTASPITVIPESADNYHIGTLGFGKFYTESLLWYFALSEDNNNATQFRTGFTLKL